MKKVFGIISITFLLIGIMILCVIYGRRGETLPKPNAIVIYYEGEQLTLLNGDEDYSKAYILFKADYSKGILETAIEDETVDDAKKEFAAEFIYDNVQQIQIGDITENITGALFFLSGYCEGEVAFSNDGNYHSGTVKFSSEKEKIKKIAEIHIRT